MPKVFGMGAFAGAVVCAVAGCGPSTQVIDDPQMQATGRQLGSQSADLASTPEDASEDDVRGKSSGIGSSLQALQGQHQALRGSAASLARVADPDTLRQSGESSYSFENGRLQFNWTNASGVSGLNYDLTYAVDLTFTPGAEGGTDINGTFDLDWTAGISGIGTAYELSAVYNGVGIDSAGCASSGSLQLDYRVFVDTSGLGGLGGLAGGLAGTTTDQSGTVIVEYTGCDSVVISGT